MPANSRSGKQASLMTTTRGSKSAASTRSRRRSKTLFTRSTTNFADLIQIQHPLKPGMTIMEYTNQPRRSGVTTAQINEAPRNGYFVWCNSNLSYPRHLALERNRPDLKIHGPSFITEHRWRGLDLNLIVIDHAFTWHASKRDLEEYDYFLEAQRIYNARRK